MVLFSWLARSNFHAVSEQVEGKAESSGGYLGKRTNHSLSYRASACPISDWCKGSVGKAQISENRELKGHEQRTNQVQLSKRSSFSNHDHGHARVGNEAKVARTRGRADFVSWSFRSQRWPFRGVGTPIS